MKETIIKGHRTISLMTASLEQILYIHENPMCTCWCCLGVGYHQSAQLVPLVGMVIMTRTCGLCSGTGMVAYCSMS